MDIDLHFSDDPLPYFNLCAAYDVTLPVSSGMRALSPWRRFMAGNCFVKASRVGGMFLDHVCRYLLAELPKEKSWMLDQNALSYGMDRVIDEEGVEGFEVVVGNVGKLEVPRPFLVLEINSSIERI